MAQNPNKCAVITGASSGIGLELSRIFAAQGWDVVLVARDTDRLNHLALELSKANPIKATVITADLSTPYGPEEVYKTLMAQGLHPEVLVNNAGYGLYGHFSNLPLIDQLKMIDLNVSALTHLTRLFLPHMLASKRGKILNVASTAAFQPGPLMAVYYATKAYVLSFSEALSNELEDTGVAVTALCPGPTHSGFQKRANLESSRMMGAINMDSQQVAAFGYKALMANRVVAIPGLKNALLAFSVRFSPRCWVLKIVRAMQEKKKG